MHHAPPPPTVFRAVADHSPELAERLHTLWRLATTDDQRWEIERLAEVLPLAAEDDDGNDFRPDGLAESIDDLYEVVRDVERAIQDIERLRKPVKA